MYYMQLTDLEAKELIKEGKLYLENGIVYMKTDRNNWSLSISSFDKDRFTVLQRDVQIDKLL